MPARGRSKLLDLLFGRSRRWTLIRATTLVVGSIGLFGWVLLPVRTYGVSMAPTYGAGQLVFVNALAYHWGKPRRGDVVAIELAGRRAFYVKRIVGMPGERIRFTGGVVLIDGRPLGEQYLKNRSAWNVPEVRLGEEEYFVVGDNRGMAPQEHEFGTVAAGRLVGKLIF